MLRNYLAVAVRTLMRNRIYAAINIGGLALGLAGCLLILNYIRYESSYDEWLPDSGRVYQVQTTTHVPGQPMARVQNTPLALRDILPHAFSQIEAASLFQTGQTVTSRDGQPIFIDTATVDPDFFQVFRLPFIAGSAAGALPNTNSVVLTRSEAIRQFGIEHALGRTMTLGAGPGKRDYVVSGILRDLPSNSNLRLSILFRYDPAQAPAQADWGTLNQQYYVKLQPGADVRDINGALPAWEKKVIPAQNVGGRTVAVADLLDFALVPIRSIHLGQAQMGALKAGGDARMLATFGIIALLTLGMAVMNFVNLSTARATQRAREVALRKTLGARRGQLVMQFLAESAFTTGIAMLIGLTLAELIAPRIGAFVHAELSITYLGRNGVLLPAIALYLLTALVGGLYPALYLSRFRPALVLRANQSTADTPAGGRLRTTLVVLQFAIAIGLIACTTIIYRQTLYAQSADPGYRRDGLIQIDAAWRFAGDDSEYRAARDVMMRLPGVVAVGRTNLGLSANIKSSILVRSPVTHRDSALGVYSIDPGYFSALQTRVLAGRLLSETFAKDRLVRPENNNPAATAQWAARGINVVINRNAANMLGFRTPEAAIGQTIGVGIEDPFLAPSTIVGVIEDTRLRTAREAVEPMVYTYDPSKTFQVIVRYAGARPADVMAGLNRVWRQFEPEIPFQARFGEAITGEAYAADQARAALFAAFSSLAILIASLGLYGLAAFTAERRTKEIGIRKVLGARVIDILRLLAWQFSKPVVLANLIAWPVGWWAMRDWLNGFDQRIALTPGPFALAGLLTLGIALLTVSGHSLRVARTRPVQALRYE